MMIRVAIVDDSRPFRQGLAAMLDFQDGFKCVGSCASAAEALRILPILAPDVVLMDINLGTGSGIDCVSELKTKIPKVNVLMLTISEDSELVFASLQAGAAGYLVKDVQPQRLIEAITEVHFGGSPITSRIARLLVQKFQCAPAAASDTESTLSVRESEILLLISKGFRDKEIADQLGIGVSTVLTHVRNIYRKLQVRSRAEAVARMNRNPNGLR